ncbi:hypothetical protein QJS10_CPA08g01227 [Acorus calamus]|uniref:RNA polymerase I-specific transcription initiation factor RRN3 n=1 Tax=Acorus calamus TaxID=4465 RepID=A0AAV9EC98_ACOCL|nr:hypothetical protein QJS10_CPA08g01227 [Acorus calamus]
MYTMGTELCPYNGDDGVAAAAAVDEMEDDCLSDSEMVASVREALKASTMGELDDSYWQLSSVFDPTKTDLGPDEEALLVAFLRGLAGSISVIDVEHHKPLINSVLQMSIWNYGCYAGDALVDFVVLLATDGKYREACLDMLVCNFMPPRKIHHSRWIFRKKEVLDRVHSALHAIADLAPLACVQLLQIILHRMPPMHFPKEMIAIYVESMLRLEKSVIGEYVGTEILMALMDRLVDYDVEIKPEDIPHDDSSKGIFDMELEDVEENRDDFGGFGSQGTRQREFVLKNSVYVQKLDMLMVITFEHLKSCADDGRLVKVFKTLVESFKKTMLKTQKSKFVQFVMFYACSLDPEHCGVTFADLLTDMFLYERDPLSRIISVAYLSSFLSRGMFIPTSLVVGILERLAAWCWNYCQLSEREEHIKVCPIFYSACQAVMYVLCFRMRSMVDVPHHKSQLFGVHLERILQHHLDPLQVCLPSIVEEFLRQAKAAHLFFMSKTFLFDDLLDSELLKSYGDMERLDMFFPFDPYLLKESDRFIRPNYVFWSMVKTTYDNHNIEDEDPDDDGDSEDEIETFNLRNTGSVGGPDLIDDDGVYIDEDRDIDEDDILESSMNKMSITPQTLSSTRELCSGFGSTARMPARIRPSVSPNL